MTILPNGIGGTAGDSLATDGPLQTSGDVWYVDSVTGNDSNDGRSRLEPFATLSQAVTDAASDDIIVLLASHAETLTSAQTISERLTIVGEGTTTTMPKLTNNQAAGQLITIASADVQLRNIWFEEDSQANSAVRVSSASARTALIGCYFEANATQNAAVVQVNTGASDLLVKNCTFISTATADDDAPVIALEITAATSEVDIEGTVFSGGTQGWKDFALKASAAAITRVRMETCSFLLGADAAFHASSTGYLQPSTTTGAVRINGIG